MRAAIQRPVNKPFRAAKCFCARFRGNLAIAQAHNQEKIATKKRRRSLRIVPVQGWRWCVWDPETLPVVPVVRLYALNGGCWGHGDGSQAIFERRSADQIHCGAMGFRFSPPPERVRKSFAHSWDLPRPVAFDFHEYLPA